ncbi:MAG: phospholipase effector Tle1 domain-containing protein [Luteimonas sp.]
MGGNRQPDNINADRATASELASFQKAQEALAGFEVPLMLDESRTEQRLFIASFDGTGNSKRDPDKLTNVARIDEQFRRYAEQAGERLGYAPIQTGYVEGPGTQGGLSGIFDAAYGNSYETRIEEMYYQFVVQAKAWLDENPDADIRILATGFSRGAEQAAGFTRLVEERGIQNPTGVEISRNADGLITGKVVYTQPPLREPGTVVQSAALFDPVGTGAPRQQDRRLAESVVSAFQITADGERRNLFQGTWITDSGMTLDGRFLNVGVAGAHSDIGGGYQRDGLGILAGNLMVDYINGQIRPPPLEKRALPDDPDHYVVHRSEEHLFIYGTSIFDRHGERGMRDLLAPPSLRQIDCRDAMPRNEAMAASLEWRRAAIGPVTGSVPVRDAGLETSTFASDLLSAAARDDGRAISERLHEQLASDAGQTWLQQGFDALERQSREFAARDGAHSLVPVHEMDGPAL